MAFATRELVTSPAGDHYLVSGTPKGGLKRITPTAGIVTWTTALPGLLGIIGLLVNKLVFRGRWVLIVEPVGLDGDVRPAIWRQTVASLAEANAQVPVLASRMRNGSGLPSTVDSD